MKFHCIENEYPNCGSWAEVGNDFLFEMEYSLLSQTELLSLTRNLDLNATCRIWYMIPSTNVVGLGRYWIMPIANGPWLYRTENQVSATFMIRGRANGWFECNGETNLHNPHRSLSMQCYIILNIKWQMPALNSWMNYTIFSYVRMSHFPF